MSTFFHRLLLTLYTLIVLATAAWLWYIGHTYYTLPVEGEARFDNPLYEILRPGGFVGHGLGIFGTLLILIGLFGYMARKRMKVFSRWGILKYWLEAHIFLCTLGYVLVTFHTSLKFGGLVSIGYWSLAVVFLSGIVGRFIYIQIPHSIEGRELSSREINELKTDLDNELQDKYDINISDLKTDSLSEIKALFLSKNIPQKEYYKIRSLIRKERWLARRIGRLDKLKELFRHWHVVHLPFAIIMLVIMVVHVSVTVLFGYNWVSFF